jgi:hypothetical protein
MAAAAAAVPEAAWGARAAVNVLGAASRAWVAGADAAPRDAAVALLCRRLAALELSPLDLSLALAALARLQRRDARLLTRLAAAARAAPPAAWGGEDVARALDAVARLDSWRVRLQMNPEEAPGGDAGTRPAPAGGFTAAGAGGGAGAAEADEWERAHGALVPPIVAALVALPVREPARGNRGGGGGGAARWQGLSLRGVATAARALHFLDVPCEREAWGALAAHATAGAGTAGTSKQGGGDALSGAGLGMLAWAVRRRLLVLERDSGGACCGLPTRRPPRGRPAAAGAARPPCLACRVAE